MIRLLPKDDILKLKANDRSREIAEGLKLTKRVDGLRELAANEEKTLNDFRNSTLVAIQAELTEANERKEKLLAEIRLLEEQAKKELNKTTKKRLEELEAKLDAKEKEIIERKNELNLQEIDIALTIKESDDALARAKSSEELAMTLHRKATNEKSIAEQALQRAQTIEQNAQAEKVRLESDLQRRDILSARREKDIEAEKEQLRIEKLALEVDKLRVKDREATLERSLERLKKHRLA